MSPQEKIKYDAFVERVKATEKKQVPFVAMFGRIMMYVIANN